MSAFTWTSGDVPICDVPVWAGGGGGDGGGSGQDWACHTQGSAGDREKCSGPKLEFQFPVQTLLPTLAPEEAPG